MTDPAGMDAPPAGGVGREIDTDYRIRIAGPADVPRLAAVERAAAQLFADIFPGEEFAETTPADLLNRAREQGQLWVALAGNMPVGFALVVLARAGEAHLEELDVHPAHGRRGLGTRLVMAVCDWAGASGLSAVTLTTFREVPWNMPFYQRIGFSVVPTDEIEPELAAIVRGEAEKGLDPASRVVMRRPV